MGGAVETSTPSQKARAEGTPSNDPFDHELRFLLSRTEMRRFLDAIAARDRHRDLRPRSGRSPTRERPISTPTTWSTFERGDGAPARRLRVREYAVAASANDAPVLSGVAFVELKQHEGAARSKMRLAGLARRDRAPHRRATTCISLRPRPRPPWSADRARAVAPHHGAAPGDLVPAALPDRRRGAACGSRSTRI